MFDYEVVIRGGRVLDGAGNPSILADVGIKDGRFAAIGQITGRAKTEIDASGKYVSPAGRGRSCTAREELLQAVEDCAVCRARQIAPPRPVKHSRCRL